MKYEDLRKKTLLETGIIAVTLVVLSAVVYGLSLVDDDFTKSNQDSKSQADSIMAEKIALETKFRNIQNNKGLYEEIQKKQAQGQLIINSQILTDIFKQFKKDFFLASLKLSMPSINEAKEADLKRKTSVVNVSDVTVDLEAISDEHIYRLMQAMQEQLPGTVSVTKLSLTKQQAVNQDILRSIAQKGPQALIKGEIRFNWYGIIPVPEAAPAEGVAPGNAAKTK